MTGSKGQFKKTIVVDFWETNLHGDKIGIYEHKRKQAQTRAFTKDIELFGVVKDQDHDDIGVFGYRKNAWEPPVKDEVDYYTRKRLIIRCFSKSQDGKIALLGTIEEMTLDSLRKTMLSDDPLHSFRVILNDYPYVVNLTKEHARLPNRVGEMWGFAIMTDPEEKRWEVFLLDERRLTIGFDFDVKRDDMTDILVHLDERVLNIGRKVVVTFYNKRLYECDAFRNTILLFAMTFKFRKELREKIKKGREAINKSRKGFTIDVHEADLMRNPRALKR